MLFPYLLKVSLLLAVATLCYRWMVQFESYSRLNRALLLAECHCSLVAALNSSSGLGSHPRPERISPDHTKDRSCRTDGKAQDCGL